MASVVPLYLQLSPNGAIGAPLLTVLFNSTEDHSNQIPRYTQKPIHPPVFTRAWHGSRPGPQFGSVFFRTFVGWAGSDRVRKCSKCPASGRVRSAQLRSGQLRSEGFQLLRVGSDQPDSTPPSRGDLTRELPCVISPRFGPGNYAPPRRIECRLFYTFHRRRLGRTLPARRCATMYREKTGVHPRARQRQRARALPRFEADFGLEGQLHAQRCPYRDDRNGLPRGFGRRSHHQHPALRG